MYRTLGKFFLNLRECQLGTCKAYSCPKHFRSRTKKNFIVKGLWQSNLACRGQSTGLILIWRRILPCFKWIKNWIDFYPVSYSKTIATFFLLTKYFFFLFTKKRRMFHLLFPLFPLLSKKKKSVCVKISNIAEFSWKYSFQIIKYVLYTVKCLVPWISFFSHLQLAWATYEVMEELLCQTHRGLWPEVSPL